jgi:predicted ATPase
MNLGIRMENLEYQISLGLPQESETAFTLDPRIKEETVEFVKGSQRVGLIKRTKGFLFARDDTGKKIEFPLDLSDSESVLSSLREPQRFPELSSIRHELLGWRFYHQFRTDSESPLRRPQTGIFTPILSHDGTDLAAALKSISATGGRALLDECINEAFPGSRLFIVDDGGRLSVALSTPEFQRAFSAQELSDGTLQYLCLLAALLSYRKPSLLALNEPETSIHPDLFRPLAKLIARAAKHSQLWITTHSRDLSDYIFDLTGYDPIELKKVDGATTVVGANVEGLINADD